MSSPSPQQFDVCIVGGGPAGSITALRLALLGHRVCLFERRTFPRQQVGESLTRGIYPILDALNLRQLLLHGALSSRDFRVLWSRPQADLLTADPMQGWLLVDRSNFDALLLRAAASTGVCILQPATVRAVSRGSWGWQITAVAGEHSWPLEAAYLVDSAGRSGFLHAKREYVSPRTIAICGYLWRQSGRGQDILVEALPDCWCWGAPVPGGKFSAMVFMDADGIATVRRERLLEFWRSRLAATELFASVSQWALAGPLLARDATSYFAIEPMTAVFARVGEANYALDPLSSTGVEKAAQSATVAATAIHTMLEQPSRGDLCLRFYHDRQQETISAHRAWTAGFYGSVARYAEMPFWRTRSKLPRLTGPEPTTSAAPPAPAAAPFTSHILVRPSDRNRLVEEPCVIDDQICLHAAVTHPNLNRPIAFLHDVALWPLLQMANTSTDVNSLIGRWSAHVPPQKARQIVQWLLDRQMLEVI
jgi:flavin-dependent dehydrogenase